MIKNGTLFLFKIAGVSVYFGWFHLGGTFQALEVTKIKFLIITGPRTIRYTIVQSSMG
jgi:hypothetical protein